MRDRTIVALAGLGVSAFLISLGHNGGIVTLIGLILGYYFGRESTEKEKAKKDA